MRRFPAYRLLVVAIHVAACAHAQVAAPAAAPAGPLDRARVLQVVDSIVGEEIAAGRAAGMSVAVVRGGDTLVLKGYGRASLELDVPTPDDAVYDIASQAKNFTAAAVLRLAEQGKLSVDDPLAKHLPGVLPPHLAERVTIRQLLSHTSGVREYSIVPTFQEIQQRSYPALPPGDTLLKLIAAQPPQFQPGAAMVYSNSGYHLLGTLVERVSGKSLEDYLAQELFPSAGLRHTRRYRSEEIVPKLTSGYVPGPRGLQPGHGFGKLWWSRGSAGYVSTAADVARWLQALHGGRILGPAAYQALVTPATLADGTPLRFGLGVVLHPVRGHRAFSHGGSLPTGFNSFGTYLPDHVLVIVVLANTYGGSDTESIAGRIVGALLGDLRPVPATFAGRTEPYAGTYRSEGEYFFDVFDVAADSAGQLTISVRGGAPETLGHYGADRFAVGRGYMYYTFLRTGDAVTGVLVEHPLGVMRFRREPAAAGQAAHPPRP